MLKPFYQEIFRAKVGVSLRSVGGLSNLSIQLWSLAFHTAKLHNSFITLAVLLADHIDDSLGAELWLLDKAHVA